LINKEYNIADFSPHLFWDVDKNNLNWEKNKAQIVKRVIEYGLLYDWKLLQQYYGLNQIGEICKDLRSLDDRSLCFISTLTGIQKESFRCYILKQSIPPHWIF
jgi:hypothetical protein